MTHITAFLPVALAFFSVTRVKAFSGLCISEPCRILTSRKSSNTWTAARIFLAPRTTLSLHAKEDDSEEEFKFDPDMPVIVRGSEEDEISDEVWENVDTGEPPQWMVMKELLGINIFTYILAAAIAVFLTLNFVLGPGWLGQALGMKGTGTFTDVSPSLPDTVDLNDPDFLL